MKSFFYALLLLLLISCNSDDSSQQEADGKRILDLGLEIMVLIDSVNCNNESECAYMPMGSKACGGPSSYLVYPTSIDIDLLTSKVELYTQMQKDYNIKYEIFSDCMFVSPPIDLICEDGKCIGIYNEIQ